MGAAGAYPAALHAALLRHHAWADVILHESPFTLPYDLLVGLDEKPRVYSSHNAEAALMRAMHPGARAAAIHALADACERALVNAADLVMVCAEGDLPELERTAGRSLPRVHLAPNGASEPWPPRRMAAAARRLLFVGSRHAPNVEAARFLTEEAMPRLPLLELHVAGACLPPGRPAPNVVCHGEVSAGALAGLLAASDVALNPMRSGGGSNLKVLDWMSAGLPIVSTPFGMRGSFAEPGRHYVAAEFSNFTDAVAALAADAGKRARLSLAGAALIRERLTWAAVARDAGEALAALRPRRRAPHALWVDDAELDDRGAALLRRLGEPAIVLRLHPGSRIERETAGATTVIRVPAEADEVARGLYDALRRHARWIVVRSEAWAEIAASFGEPYDFAPDPGPMTTRRAFCARNAARLAAASAEDAVRLSAMRTDRGGPLPVISSATGAARLDPPPPAPRRLLVATYRWTEPPLGGAEVLLRELLTRLDAGGGWDVDVVAPDVGAIANDERFACVYGDAAGLGSVPGLLRTRWRRFPLASGTTAGPAEMERAWEVQAEFDRAASSDPEMAAAAALGPRLLEGWWRRCMAGSQTFRWTTEHATFHAGGGGRLVLEGEAPRRMSVTVTADGVTASLQADGRFAMEVELPAGSASIRCDARRIDWPEMGPAGLRVTRLAVDGSELIDGMTLAEAAGGLPFAPRVALLDRAARASRFAAGTELTRLRGPHAPQLTRWLDRHVAEYDVVLAQNCVFRPAVEALAAARAKGVPSVFVPHIHLDDDFYHFPDIAGAFRDATVSLVSPRAASDASAASTGADVRYFAAGVDAEEFSAGRRDRDVAAYREMLPADGRPELLVLGRKAQAKNWRTVLDARRLLQQRGVRGARRDDRARRRRRPGGRPRRLLSRAAAARGGAGRAALGGRAGQHEHQRELRHRPAGGVARRLPGDRAARLRGVRRPGAGRRERLPRRRRGGGGGPRRDLARRPCAAGADGGGRAGARPRHVLVAPGGAAARGPRRTRGAGPCSFASDRGFLRMTHPAIAPGRAAVVTGAASGIGLAAAKLLAARGMAVCMADVDAAALEREGELLRAGGARVLTQVVDVSRTEQVEALRDAAVEAFGPVSVLMNNAGREGGGGLSAGPERWRAILETNLWGVLNGVQAFTPGMVAHGGPAAIVNTGSKQGITTPPGDAAYNVSKAGIKVLTEALAHDLLGTQVTAHLLIPGFTFTGFTRKRTAERPPEAWTADQVADFMLEKMSRGDFYILCPDNDTTREQDEKRMRWAAEDVVCNRPALSRWHPEWTERFKAYMAS